MRAAHIPEPCLVPPEDDCVIAGGCGHEVYDGERFVEWYDGRRFTCLCEDCFRDTLAALTTEELARRFGCACVTVSIP